MTTTAIVFDHRGRTKKGRQGSVEVRVTIDRKVYYISSGVKVLRSEFKNGVIINRPDSDEMNELLSSISKAITAEINACISSNTPIDVAQIRRAVWGCRDEDPNTAFLDWFEDTYPSLPLTSGTKAHYKTTLSRVRACSLINNWADLTTENIIAFDNYLRSLSHAPSDAAQKAGISGTKLSQAAIYNHHKDLKAMITRAVVSGKIDRNPYDRLKGQFKRGDKETVSYLTDEEVAAFMSQRPVVGTMMATARDLFVFQLYTGLSYTDMQRFDIRQYKCIAGKWVNVGERIKTGVPYVSQLLPPAVEVLERYNWSIPHLENHKYNVCLRALGVAAGIATPLHSHIARHTFATMMLRHGAKIENVARMLGHTNIKQTQRYAKVLAQSVYDDFDKIAQLLEQQKSASTTDAPS